MDGREFLTSRRRFLTAAAGVGSASIATAGCLAAATPAPPSLPEDRLDADGWELVEEERGEAFSETYLGRELTATATTEVYENVPLREELAGKTLGEVTDAPVSFFASRVTFDPNLADLPADVGSGLILDEVEANAREMLETRMAENGVEDVEETGSGTLTVDSGEEARRTDLRGTLPFEPISLPVAGDEPVTLAEDVVPIAGRLAVWEFGETVLVGGGAFPAENVATSLNEDLSSAISVAIEVDLGLEPERYEVDLLDLVRAVE